MGAADGKGYSLVLSYEGIAADHLGNATAWRRSAFLGGSPGAPDAVSVPDMRVAIEHSQDSVIVHLRAVRSRGYTVWSSPTLDATQWVVERVVAPRTVERIEQINLPADTNGKCYRVTSP